MDQLHEPELQMQTRLLAVIQLVEGAQHYLQEASQVFFAKQSCGTYRTGAFIRRGLQQFGLLAAQLGTHLSSSAAVGVIWPSLLFPDDDPASTPSASRSSRAVAKLSESGMA